MSSVRLIDCLGTTPELAEIFSNESVLQAMLNFESALARAEASLKIIPPSAAREISKAAKASGFDAASLAVAASRAGTPAIPLVKALTAKVHRSSAEGARFVHWGATSQDVTDTAMVLLLWRVRLVFERDLDGLEQALDRISDSHSESVALGRTLLQPAPPVTLGLRAAGWLGAVRRCGEALSRAFDEALVVQLGGASGTMAALGSNGVKVGEAIARELNLKYPDAPWHAHRDRVATLISACAILTGTLGKMARDISLLMQAEIAEVCEPGGKGRGGSSTMPHKANPIGCSLAIAAGLRTPGLVASYLSAMVQEHERAAGGTQAEWSIISDLVQATGVALASMKEVAAGLTVDPARMRENIEATHGSVFAERAMMLMAPKIGRGAAHKILEKAARNATKEGRRLSEVLAEMPDAARHLDREALRRLEEPEEYLGVAEEFRERLIARRKVHERNGKRSKARNARKNKG